MQLRNTRFHGLPWCLGGSVFVLFVFPFIFFSNEVEFTGHKINHFQEHHSVSFSTFTVLCNHHLYLLPDIFITQKEAPVPIK